MYTFETRVRYSECNPKGQAGISNILDYLQDTCCFQAEDLNIGEAYLKAHHLGWVLSSWQVDIARYPDMGEQIRISTWPYDFYGFYGLRNFKIVDEKGDLLVRANSVWVFMDFLKGRPVKLTTEITQAYQKEPRLEMEYLDRKLQDFEATKTGVPFCVPQHFIDTNSHMNNSRYVLLAEEYLPEDYEVVRIRAEYRRSAMLGDTLYPAYAYHADRTAVRLDDEKGKTYALIEFYPYIDIEKA